MTWTLWGWFLLTEIVVSVSPGPAVFFVLAQALRNGQARARWATVGILAVNALFFVLSAAGLGAMLVASHRVFEVIKWVGAGYLVVLGVRTIVGSKGTSLVEAASETEIGARGEADWRTMTRAAMMQLANPKALLFFTALLPQFIRPSAPVGSQMFILGATSIVAELIVLTGYGLLAGRLSAVARQPRFATATNRVAGTLMVGAGVGIALASER